MKKAILILLTLIFFQLKSQSSLFSERDLTALDIINYTEWTRIGLHNKIYKLISTGEIQAYSDINLKKKYTVSEFMELGTTTEKIKIPNSQNHSDIDSFVIRPYHPPYSEGFKIALSNILIYKLTKTDSVFLRFKKVKDQLTEEQKVFFEFYSSRGIYDINFHVDKKFILEEFGRYSEKLYNLGRNGIIKAYKNDSFNSYYDTSEIYHLGSIYRHKSAPIPLYEYKDSITLKNFLDGYDSVKVVFFNPQKKPKLRFLDRWTTNGYGQVEVSTFAVAPMYYGISTGFDERCLPLFFLNYEKVQKNLYKAEKNFYSYLLMFHLKNVATNESRRTYYYNEWWIFDE